MKKVTADDAVQPEDTKATASSAEVFEAQVKEGVINAHPYNRLMIVYRKEKRYADELRVVKRAISVFEQHLKSVQQGILKGGRKSAKIRALSNTISKRTGLVDNHGKAAHVPEPIAGWLKRKVTIEKKIAATPKKGSGKTRGR